MTFIPCFPQLSLASLIYPQRHWLILHLLPALPGHSRLLSLPQTLHSKGLASADHTTLLLNCYTKLKDVDKLDAFIYGGGGGGLDVAGGEGGGEDAADLLADRAASDPWGDDAAGAGGGGRDGSFSLGSKGVEVLDAFIQVSVGDV